MSKPLKEGYLMKAHPREGLFAVTVWQKRYFVLWPTGTMEYYTSYQKSPEEYCSTMDLKETIDILAPVSVGKKHNVIKITVKKNNRVKDYWLDCDCPSLMDEWVNHIITVAGLSPEDQDDCFAGSQSQQEQQLKRNNVSKRRLPSLPIVMDMEYEVPNTTDGDHYEEISPVGSPVPNVSRRYSKGSVNFKQNIKGTELVKGDMLKRSPLPVNESGSPSPTHLTSVTFGSPPSTSPPPPSTSNFINPELQRKLSVRRQELYDTRDNVVPVDDGETYEEVQITTEVTVGERNQSNKVVMRNKNLADEVPGSRSVHKSPIPTHHGNQGGVTSNNNDIEKRPPIPVPLRDSVLLELSGNVDLTMSPPPPVPPREQRDPESPPLYMQHDNPPPVPVRSSQPPRAKIQSYYTTEIKQSSSSTSVGYHSESSEQSSSSGDAVVTKTTPQPTSISVRQHSQSLSLLATVVGGAATTGKPAPPPVKSKQKPAPPIKSKKPNTKPVSQDDRIDEEPRSPIDRAPAKLPKPNKVHHSQGRPPVAPKTKQLSYQSPDLPPKLLPVNQPPIVPSKNSTQKSPTVPPKRMNSPKKTPQNIHRPPPLDIHRPPPIPKTKPSTNGTVPVGNNNPPHFRSRPPMPLPKGK